MSVMLISVSKGDNAAEIVFSCSHLLFGSTVSKNLCPIDGFVGNAKKNIIVDSEKVNNNNPVTKIIIPLIIVSS